MKGSKVREGGGKVREVKWSGYIRTGKGRLGKVR